MAQLIRQEAGQAVARSVASRSTTKTPRQRGPAPLLSIVPREPSSPGFCSLVARVLRSHRCSIMLTGEDGHLIVEESIGLPPGIAGAAWPEFGSGVAGRAALDKAPVLVNSVAERAGLPQPVGVYATDSFISYPITLPDGTTGVVNVTDRTDGMPFGTDDLSLLEHLTSFYVSTYDAPSRREVLRLRGELRKLRARTIRAQEQERQRLARELHDDAGHALTAAILRIDMAAQRLIGTGPITDALADVRETLTECADHLHDLAFNLRPRLLADLGLAPALRSLARRIQENSDVDAEVIIRGQERRLAEETELAAFRIAQEAVTNTLKHAKASRVTIHLTLAAPGVVLEIADNGIGLDLGSDNGTGCRDHHGVHGMRERAELAGGVLEVTPRSGGGTIIRARLPERTVT